MPMGDSVPLGVIRLISSPTNAPSCLAISSPITMPPSAAPSWVPRSARLPRVTAAAIPVTVGSSFGSMPLTLMKTSRARVRASALPTIAGAAASTRGKAVSLRASAS